MSAPLPCKAKGSQFTRKKYLLLFLFGFIIGSGRSTFGCRLMQLLHELNLNFHLYNHVKQSHFKFAFLGSYKNSLINAVSEKYIL